MPDAQLRADQGEPAGLLGELGGVGLAADLRGLVGAGAGDDEAAGQHLGRRPACRTGSASPVSSDSSTSSASASTTTPSTTTLSPGPSSMTSSSTTSCGASSAADAVAAHQRPGLADDRELVQGALGAQLLDDPDAGVGDDQQPNRPSWIGDPMTRMIANSTPMIALNRVNTLARTISPIERARGGHVVGRSPGDPFGDLGGD